MLERLRRIVQEVGTAVHLDEALAIIVRRVKEAMDLDACSVYLTDSKTGEHVLMATEGLNSAAIGQVRLGPREGLIGLVAERQEPVNLENAAEHPRYRFSQQTGEERYRAFLAVPIIHYRRVLGVLVARHRDRRLFDEDEVSFLVTIGAQLAGAIAGVVHGQAIAGAAHVDPLRQIQAAGYVQGVKAAPGVAIGTIVLPSPLADLASVPDRTVEDTSMEESAFLQALADVQTELRATGARMATMLPGEVHGLFDVYAMFVTNDQLVAETVQRIRSGQWAPAALRDTIAEHARVFDQMDDPYLQARGEDIRAIGRRILYRMRVASHEKRPYPERCVLVGEEVSIARIADVPPGRLAGIVCMRGSAYSHTAIMARALGVPAVMGVGSLPLARLEGVDIVVDSYQGRVFIDPSPSVREEFERLMREEDELSAALSDLRDLPAETPDGVRLPLYVNTGLMSDLVPALNSGAEGIGLHRTEFPFMVRDTFPGEEDQYQIYRHILEAFSPRPVTLRTLDVGGDKTLPYFRVHEHNPFLGWRGIRLTLDHPEIFLAQLRAMLRANAGLGNLQVLFPMVSRVAELDEALALIERAYQELVEEARPAARPRVGVMVEVPSAVYLADALAARVDFLSIGTNDLTQYLLAVDRNNARVASLFDDLHPAVIRAMCDVVQRAHACGKPVSVCGELAGDPAGALLLLGMGIDSLSMSASRLPRVKWAIRTMPAALARTLLEQASAAEDETTIHRLLNAALEQAGLHALVRSADG